MPPHIVHFKFLLLMSSHDTTICPCSLTHTHTHKHTHTHHKHLHTHTCHMTSEPYMLTWALPPPIRRKLFRVIPLLASSWVVPTMCPKRGRGGPTRCAQQRAASAQPSLFHRRLRHRSSSTTACSHVHPSARVRRATQVARLAAVGGSKASSSRSTSKGHPTKAMAGSWFQQLVQVGSEQEVCVFVCTWLLPCCVPFSLFYSPLTLSLSRSLSLLSLYPCVSRPHSLPLSV